MARLNEYFGHFCESEYEYAFIGLLEAEGWSYLAGNNIPRPSKRDVLYTDDLAAFVSKTNPDLKEEEDEGEVKLAKNGDQEDSSAVDLDDDMMDAKNDKKMRMEDAAKALKGNMDENDEIVMG